MISNERQYKISKNELEKFEKAIDQARAQGPREHTDPILHEAAIAGMESQAQELREDVDRYEALRDGKIVSSMPNELSEVGPALIEARIAAGLTHKALAEQLHVKEQQVQRWEATRYEGTNTQTVNTVLKAVNAKLRGLTIVYASAKADKQPQEVLLVAAKVKAAIKEAGCNTGGDVIDAVNMYVHWVVGQAASHAQANGRKTVRANDVAAIKDREAN